MTNRRAIVTAGTGDFYCKNLDRLLGSFAPSCNVYKKTKDGYWHTPKFNTKTVDLLCWYDCLPEGSRAHEESPYGFKVFAFKSAIEKGYTSVLWIDSAAYAVKEDISPIFEKIEKEGYYAMSHIDPLERFVGDSLLRFYNVKRSELIGLNLPSGSCYGFDKKSSIGSMIFANMELTEVNGLFDNEIGEDFVHRHDEAVLAVYLKLKDKPVFTFDPIFQSESPECVIKSGGL